MELTLFLAVPLSAEFSCFLIANSCLKSPPSPPASIPHRELFFLFHVVSVSTAEVAPSSADACFVLMAALFPLPVPGR